MHDILISAPFEDELMLSCQRCGWTRTFATPKYIGYLLSESNGHDCPVPGQLAFPFGGGE